MKKFVPFFIGILLHFLSFAQADTIGLHRRLKQHLLFLTNDSMKGRSVGTEEELMAGNYFLKQTKTERKSRVYTWRFPVTKKDSSAIITTMFGRFINNRSPYTIIVGAHIDHIGFGDQLSLSFGSSDVHNGADDNASGVALLIELCRTLQSKKLPFNMLFVPFTAHEIGTFGSEHLASNLPKSLGKVIAMLNMDMVGRMNHIDKTLYVSSTDSLINDAEYPFCNIIISDTKRVLQLDTRHFVARGIPSATFTTGMHLDYHKTSDDEQYINYAGMKATFMIIYAWIADSASKKFFRN